MIQHDLFQRRHKASVDGMISFSNVILSQMFWRISLSHALCCCSWSWEDSENLLKCETGELVSNPEACFLQ